jgi:hypothetical protein
VKFYLDENFTPDLVHPLRSIYLAHTFASWAEEDLGGTLDVDLFPALTTRGFEAIVTRDRRQLTSPTERTALAESGLRWIGMRTTKLSGLGMLSITAASLIAGLRYVIEHEVERVEHVYLINTVPHSQAQRIKIIELERPPRADRSPS